jgi:hypothetical protein
MQHLFCIPERAAPAQPALPGRSILAGTAHRTAVAGVGGVLFRARSNVSIVSTPSESDLESILAEIDTTKPHSARIYDYFLGGKDNFAADRVVAEKAIAAWPGILVASRENRAFIGRAVRYLAAEAGIVSIHGI